MASKRLTRRDFLRMSALVAGGAAIAACTPQQPAAAPTTAPAAATSAPAAPTTAPAPAAAVELNALIPTSTYAQNIADGFNAENQGKISVKLEQIPYNDLNAKMAAYVGAGAPPDLSHAFTGYTLDFYKQGILDPIDVALGPDWVAALLPALTQPPHGDVIDGHIYLGYDTMSLLAIMARRDILKKLSVDPYSFKTFDDYVAGAQKVSEGSEIKKPISMTLGTPLGAAETTRWVWTSNGCENIADFKPEHKDNYIAALNAVLKMAPWVPEAAFTWDYGNADQGFAEGTTAFYAIGSWYFGSIFKQSPQAVSEDRSIPIPYPGGPGLPEQSVKFNANGWYLLSGGKHKPEAAAFIKYATSKPTLLKYVNTGDLLVFKDITDDEQMSVAMDPAQKWYLRDWAKLSHTFKLTVDIPYVAAAETQQIWQTALVNMMRGSATPEQTYDQLNGRIVPLQKKAG